MAVPITARLGALVVLAAVILFICAELATYVEVDRGPVRAEVDAFAITAYAVALGTVGATAALLMAGRGGRVLLAVLLPAVALGPARLALTYYAGHDGGVGSHHVVEYYFGVGQYPGGLEPRTGWWLAITGAVLLCIGGLLLAVAWPDTGELLTALSPGAYRTVTGAALLILVGVVVAHLLAPALTIRRTYRDASGLILTQDVPAPHTELALLGWGLLGGILVIAGWLAVAATIAAATSRDVLLGVLLGSAGVTLAEALLLARDIAAGPDLIPGPRAVLLMLAGVALGGLAWWTGSARPTRGVDRQRSPAVGTGR